MQAHFIVILLDAVEVAIKWDGKVSKDYNITNALVNFASYIFLEIICFYFQQLIHVEVKENLWNRTEGLCGVIDGDAGNDIMTKEGIIPKNILTAVTSWKVDDLDCK